MFSKIKVGDIVIVHTWIDSYTNTHHKYRLGKVTKVNKNTFKLDISTKTFTLACGSVYGGNGWERINILKYDAEFYEKKVLEVKQEELRREMLHKARSIEYEELTTEQLERIIKISEENKVE